MKLGFFLGRLKKGKGLCLIVWERSKKNLITPNDIYHNNQILHIVYFHFYWNLNGVSSDPKTVKPSSEHQGLLGREQESPAQLGWYCSSSDQQPTTNF